MNRSAPPTAGEARTVTRLAVVLLPLLVAFQARHPSDALPGGDAGGIGGGHPPSPTEFRGVPTGSPPMEVPVDLKPGSCPNHFNAATRGIVPAAILGTADFDVSAIDPETVTLAGVSPLRTDVTDVATPFEPYVGRTGAEDCTAEGADGFADLALKFHGPDLVAAVGSPGPGDVLTVSLEGELRDGTRIVGEDVLVVRIEGTE